MHGQFKKHKILRQKFIFLSIFIFYVYLFNSTSYFSAGKINNSTKVFKKRFAVFYYNEIFTAQMAHSWF